jgi:dCTP deaminase
MLLQDVAIREAIETRHFSMDPYDPSLIQPASYDVRLGSSFRVLRTHDRAYVSSRHDDLKTELREVGGGQPYILQPGEFVLASTLETVRFPDDLAGRIEGKSSLGRIGLMLHSTAGWIDPGFMGQITLELSNAIRAPILLWPGDPIGQLCLIRCEGPSGRPYGSRDLGSRYQHQVGPTAARPRLQ